MWKRLLAICLLGVALLTMTSCESEQARLDREIEAATKRRDEAKKARDEALAEYNSIMNTLELLERYSD